MKLLLTFTLLLAVSPFHAQAQAQAQPQKCEQTIESAFAISTSVVAAEAISVKTEFAGHPLNRTKPREVQIVTWSVLESWKGDLNPTDIFDSRTVINIINEDGMSIHQNEAYLLYQMDPSWVGTCSRSSVLKHAIRDIPVLYDLKERSKGGT